MEKKNPKPLVCFQFRHGGVCASVFLYFSHTPGPARNAIRHPHRPPRRCRFHLCCERCLEQHHLALDFLVSFIAGAVMLGCVLERSCGGVGWSAACIWP